MCTYLQMHTLTRNLSNLIYHIPITCCIPRLTSAMPAIAEMVVMTDASTKNKIKNGNTFFKENVFSVSFPSFLSLVVLQNANTRVIGMIANVLVSFTIVAVSSAPAPG